jgi:hypothetical protein
MRKGKRTRIQRMVVFPALSSPRTRIRASLSPKNDEKSLETKIPIPLPALIGYPLPAGGPLPLPRPFAFPRPSLPRSAPARKKHTTFCTWSEQIHFRFHSRISHQLSDSVMKCRRWRNNSLRTQDLPPTRKNRQNKCASRTRTSSLPLLPPPCLPQWPQFSFTFLRHLSMLVFAS